MASSSYDKIGNAFTKSSEWKQLSDGFRRKLRSAGITKYVCNHYQDYESKGYIINVNLILRFGTQDLSLGSTTFENFRFPIMAFVKDEELCELADKLFGTKGHPTYFCKKEKLFKKWPEFARERLASENKDLIAEYEVRIQEQRTAMLALPELEQDKKRCYELAVISDIREAVQKFYRSVGPEVLKEALDLVVTHSIMES